MVSPSEILEVVAKHFDVTTLDITGRSREQNIVEARFIFCLIVAEETGRDNLTIGRYINRDRTTVNHALIKAKCLIETSKSTKKLYENIKNEITLE